MSASKYRDAVLALFAMGWQRAVAERVGLLGRVLLYGLVLLIFAGVWQATPIGEIPGLAYDQTQLLWYVAVTEWIVFATAYPYRQIEADVLKGRIAWLGQRPLPYAAQIAAEWAGATAFRLAVLGGFGFAATAFMTGAVPIAAAAIPGLVIGALVAMALSFTLQLAIGLVAVWLRTAAPIWWVAQKLYFVLGGLLLPLPIYPGLFRGVAEASPFAAMLYWPASLVFGADGTAAVLTRQLAWLVVMLALAGLTQRIAFRRIQRNGD